MKEIWKDIQGYENLYQVSSMGRVKSLNYKRTGKERILNPQKDKNNYLKVSLSKEEKIKQYFVHRLVAQAFIPNPDNLPQVNHKDENPNNNCVDNLEWCTQKYNINYGTRLERCSKAHKGRKHTQEHNERMGKAHRKPILQLSKSENIILGKYNSVTQASKELNINRGNISSCCKEKYKSCGGYRWMYLNDYEMVLKKAS